MQGTDSVVVLRLNADARSPARRGTCGGASARLRRSARLFQRRVLGLAAALSGIEQQAQPPKERSEQAPRCEKPYGEARAENTALMAAG